MKRLTSILLALLMLVGMALAETSDDTLLGDWYGLWADTPFHLMLAENDEFQMSAGDFSCAGRWWQTCARTRRWKRFRAHGQLKAPAMALNVC